VEQAAQPIRVVRFGVYEIDLEAGELRKSGRKVSLQEQPFQVLGLLLDHPGKLVTREELQRQLWPADTFVDFDLGLNTAIKKIRAALGDSADNPKFIETLPKRGYRFICPVEEITPAGPGQANESIAALPSSITETEVRSSAAQAPKAGRYRMWLAMGALLLLVVLLGFSFDRFRHGKIDQHANGQLTPSIDTLRLEEQGTRNAAAYQAYLKGLDFLQTYDMPQKNDNAIQAFKQAIQEDPSYAIAYAGLGEASWKKFEATHDDQWSAQAQAACNRGLELDARRPEVHNCQGIIHNGVGHYERAIDDFSASIELNPRNTEAYRGRAWAYQRLNQDAQAEKDDLQAIQLDPRNCSGYTALAQLYLAEGQYNEAARQYEKAIEVKPDNSELLFSLGAAYVDTGQYDRAISVSDMAVRLRPSFAAYENAGTAWFDERRFPEAIKSFEKAVEIAPEDYRTYGNLARAYFWAPNQRGLAKEKYERAIAMAQQKLTVNAKDPDVNLNLAIYHAMLSHKDDALYYLDRALQLQPDAPEAAFWAGVVHVQLDNRAKALAWLRRAQKLKYSAAEINAAPEFDGLRRDPEFQRSFSAGANSSASGSDPQSNRRTK
jgi:tetratricopeptide (TPR) repeat protein